MAEIKYLSIEDVKEVNKQLVKKYGGSVGFSNKSNLEFTLAKMKASEGIYKKAAILMHWITTGHVFIDANKRTAFDATLIFLSMNDIKFKVDIDEAEEIMVKMAQPKGMTLKEVEDWIKRHCG